VSRQTVMRPTVINAVGVRTLSGRRDERGASAIELTLIAPVLMVILLFVVGLGRMAHARQQIESVAADSARAASLERNTSQSARAAQIAAAQSLGEAGVACTNLRVDVDLSSYQPGGRVGVTVTCTTQLRDVALAGFPGSRVFSATSIVPIETYRGG
jgi:Flp pilus assembly protein TadG